MISLQQNNIVLEILTAENWQVFTADWTLMLN